MTATTPPIRKPTRKEVDLYYKTHRSQFLAPERVHALHIVKNIHDPDDREAALKNIRHAEERLKAGEAFAIVADSESDCRGNGGDLGWFGRGVMVEEFEDVVFALSPGEQSSVFESRFGFHIVRLVEKRQPGIQPLREVYEAIEKFLIEQMQRGNTG